MLPSAHRLPALCALSALGGLVFWVALAWTRAGAFEYPLDDVYIHLAMARGIMGGTYGINPGEPASAASSILYPLLLLPLAASDLQRFLPLALNAAALAALAWLFGRWIVRAGHTASAATALAIIAPFALAMPGVAALGMEHTLHALAAMMVLAGLWDFLVTGRIGWMLVAGAILAPMFRFEGLALSLAACLALALRGRGLAGATLAGGVVMPVVLFMAFLLSQGLPPLPNSVLAKMGGKFGGYDPSVRLIANFLSLGGVAMAVAYGLLVAAFVSRAAKSDARLRLLAACALIAVTAHLLMGQVGWLGRYEHYAIVMIAAVLVMAEPQVGRSLRLAIWGAALGGAVYYSAVTWHHYNWTAQAVHLQQHQMARLVALLPGRKVAVNDIGWVSWIGQAPVLDLWGLASTEARRARIDPPGGLPAPGWAGDLARRHGAQYAMVYADWFEDGIGDEWVPVAQLTMTHPRGNLGGNTVTIYAIDPAITPDLRAAVDRLAADLPPGATLEAVPEGQ